MPRRIKKSPSLLAPLKDNFHKKLSGANKRLRRKIVRYGFWATGLFFAYSLISGTYGIPRIIRLELEKNTLIDTNRSELAKLIDANRIKSMLLHDPDYIEYIARTKYYMTYGDETIYRFYGQ